MNAARPRQERAFTLMEVLVSTAVLGIVLTAVGSAMLVTTRAMPGQDNTNQNALDAVRTLDFMTSELSEATAVPEFTARAVTVTVPARGYGGHYHPADIRYAWSGTPGDPLTRQVDGGTVATFIENVHHFAVSGDLREVPGDGGAVSEGAERLLVSHGPNTGGDQVSQEVRDSNWPGQYFRPILSGGAVGWRVTRIRFQAKRSGLAVGELAAVLCRADADCEPAGSPLAWTIMQEAGFGSDYAWQDFPVVGAPVLRPDEGAALVLAHISGLSAAWIRCERNGADTPDAHYIESGDHGATWTADTAADMVIEVYGKVTGSDAASRYYLTAARLVLQAGDDPAARVETAFPVFNEPEVPGPPTEPSAS